MIRDGRGGGRQAAGCRRGQQRASGGGLRAAGDALSLEP